MTLPVRTTPEADVQILEIDGWWRRNRDASPNLFLQELTAAFDIVATRPISADSINCRQYPAHVAFC